MQMSATTLRVGQALAIALGARTAWLFLRYALGVSGTLRHHVESAAAALIIVGGLLLLTTSQAAREKQPRSIAGAREWILWCTGSLVLYWPSMSVGLLSDDFVLAERAQSFEVGLVHAEFFRPLPLLVWSAVIPIAGAVGLHAVNVVAHGLVAFLTARWADPFVGSRVRGIVAGLLVLAFPAAVEAVTWNSGVFDVTAALLTLGAVLAARRYQTVTRVGTRATMVACAVAALMCKETAIVAPALIALDAWARRQWTRRLLADLTVLTVLFAGVGVLRLSLASELVRQPLSKYIVQRWSFGTIGGLAYPWHSQAAAQWPWLAAAGVVLTIALATAFFVSRKSSDETRAAAAAAGWLFLGSVPTLTFFFVGPDLQGSRYLYLPAIGFAGLLSVMAAAKGVTQFLGTSTLVVLLVGGLVGVRMHQRFWLEAAAARDSLVGTARGDSRLRACPAVTILGLPDVVHGAYVFRNGGEIALRSIGVSLTNDASRTCTFRWDDERHAFSEGR